jgi:hypothetical protein
MSAAKRLAACLVAMVTCLAVLLAVRDWPNAPEHSNSKEVHPPKPQVQYVERRIRAKGVVVERLLEGELSLVQAAAMFRRLNEHPPACRVDPRHCPGKSEGERLCRQVLGWVEAVLRTRGLTPSEIESALCPLQCELQTLLDQNDEIELPPVGEWERRPE